MKKKHGAILKKIAVIICCILLTMFLSAVLAMAGGSKASFVLLGGMAGLFLFALDDEQLLALTLFTVLLVVGQLTYFANIYQALWIPYGLCALLYLRMPGAYLNSPLTKAKLGQPLVVPILFFMGVVVIAALLNRTPLLLAVVGGKGYLMLWALCLLIGLYAVQTERLERGLRLLMPFILLQVPFVLYQYFVVAPKRSNLGGLHGVSWDAVVGSMGGDANGGGASGSMAFMVVLGVLLAFSRWRQGRLRLWQLSCLVLAALLCIGLAEVKVVAVILPLGMLVLFRAEVARRPVRALLGGVATVALVIGILALYAFQHYDRQHAPRDLSSLYEESFGYSTDASFINYETGEMGRMAALSFWWHDGFRPDPLRGVLGYGPGASRKASQVAVGEVAQKYKFAIDRSAASQMLWDLGLAGCLGFAVILALGAWHALRCSAHTTDPDSKAMLEACGTGLALAVVMLLYGKDLLEVPGLTFTVMCMLGYVGQVKGRHMLQARQQRQQRRADLALYPATAPLR